MDSYKKIIPIMFVFIFIAYLIKRVYTRDKIIALITSMSKSAGIDPAIMLAIARQESNFNPYANNPTDPGAGSFGLFGITLNLAKKFNPRITANDLYLPTENIKIAIKLYKDNLKFTKTVSDIFDVWNAGLIKKGDRYIPRPSPNLMKYVSYYKIYKAKEV